MNKTRQKIWICFNPSCRNGQKRFVEKMSQHPQQCQKWMVEEEMLRVMLDNSKMYKEKEKNIINFREESLIDNLTLLKKITTLDWKKELEQEKLSLMAKLQSTVYLSFQTISEQLQQLSFPEMFQQLQNILNSHLLDKSSQIEHLSHKYLTSLTHHQYHIQYKYPLPCQFESIIEKLKSTISGSLLSKQKLASNTVFISLEESQKFEEYLQLNSTPSFNKIQQIASLCNRKVESFKVGGKDMKLVCPFCEYVEEQKIQNSQKNMLKNMKMRVSDRLFDHFKDEHYYEIYGYFDKTRLEPVELTYREVLQQASLYQKIKIIDRETGITYDQEPGVFAIEIVSEQNKKMVKTQKYLKTSQRKETELLICFLFYELMQSYFGKKQVKIFSKSLSQKLVLACMSRMKQHRALQEKKTSMPPIKQKFTFECPKQEQIWK